RRHGGADLGRGAASPGKGGGIDIAFSGELVSGSPKKTRQLNKPDQPCCFAVCSTAKATSGTSSITLSNARAGPRGERLPCSQLLTVSIGTPMRAANCAWVSLVRARTHRGADRDRAQRSEEHTSELQSRGHLVCRLPL